MPSVNKGSGKYYFDEHGRVWRESYEAGAKPEMIGKWFGDYQFPNPITAEALRDLANGVPLDRVQKNRIGVYDVTFTWHKSVSLISKGLTPPSEWKEWTRELSDIVKRAMRPVLDSQFIKLGAQGKERHPSHGIGVLFAHWKSYFGFVHEHRHLAVLNLSSVSKGPRAGKVGSIGNVRDTLYDQQGELRAKVQKQTEDLCRSKGFKTYRDGKAVAIHGIPSDMLREMSPAREAMEHVRANPKTKARTKTARSEDYLARAARGEGKRREVTPEIAHHETLQIAKRYGVTLDSLRVDPKSLKLDRKAAEYFAYALALKARDHCAETYGNFSGSQFRERLYITGIGTPTSFRELETVGSLFLRSPQVAGIHKLVGENGVEQFFTEKSKQTVANAERPFVRDAWKEFKHAAKNLGDAALIVTAKKATKVMQQITDSLTTEPRIVRVHVSRLGDFIDNHRPTSFLRAHAMAMLKIAATWGNIRERAIVGERHFAALRSHARVRKNTVIVVKRGDLATAKELHQLARIAKRDGASVVISERPEPERRFVKADRRKAKTKFRNHNRPGPGEHIH